MRKPVTLQLVEVAMRSVACNTLTLNLGRQGVLTKSQKSNRRRAETKKELKASSVEPTEEDKVGEPKDLGPRF